VLSSTPNQKQNLEAYISSRAITNFLAFLANKIVLRSESDKVEESNASNLSSPLKFC